MSRYGNWGRPTPISELKFFVQEYGRKSDPTSQRLTKKYYRYYKNAGGKSTLRKILEGKDVPVPKRLR